MTYTTLDYVVVAVTAGAGVLGAFVGFSGAVAMLSGVIASVLTARLAWPLSAQFLGANWSRALVVLIAALVAFGLVRYIVRKCVNGLLAQPADAIFGALSGGILGLVAALFGVWLVGISGLVATHSNIYRAVLPLVGL